MVLQYKPISVALYVVMRPNMEIQLVEYVSQKQTVPVHISMPMISRESVLQSVHKAKIPLEMPQIAFVRRLVRGYQDPKLTRTPQPEDVYRIVQ
jgi:hypothetical protein